MTCDYGLTGYVWTNDLTRALRFTDRLEAGMIWVNSRERPPPADAVRRRQGQRHRPRRRRLVVRILHGAKTHRLRHRRAQDSETRRLTKKRRQPEQPCPFPPPFSTRPSTSSASATSNTASPIWPKSRAFYVDTLGLQVTDEDDTDASICAPWKNAGITALSLVQAEKADVGVLGFKLFDEPDLDKAEAFFKAKGLPAEWVERPFMGRVLCARATLGAFRWNST